MESIIEAYQEERYTDCLNLADAVIFEDSSNFDALSYKATSLLKLNRYKEAVDIFNKCIVLDNTRFFIWVLRGDAFYDSGDYERAFSDYWISLQLEPDNGAVVDKMSRALFRLGDEEKALIYIEKAVNLGESPEPIMVMLVMLNKMGAYGFLHRLYDLGIKKFPDEKERLDKYYKGL